MINYTLSIWQWLYVSKTCTIFYQNILLLLLFPVHNPVGRGFLHSYVDLWRSFCFVIFQVWQSSQLNVHPTSVTCISLFISFQIAHMVIANNWNCFWFNLWINDQTSPSFSISISHTCIFQTPCTAELQNKAWITVSTAFPHLMHCLFTGILMLARLTLTGRIPLATFHMKIWVFFGIDDNHILVLQTSFPTLFLWNV